MPNNEINSDANLVPVRSGVDGKDVPMLYVVPYPPTDARRDLPVFFLEYPYCGSGNEFTHTIGLKPQRVRQAAIQTWEGQFRWTSLVWEGIGQTLIQIFRDQADLTNFLNSFSAGEASAMDMTARFLNSFYLQDYTHPSKHWLFGFFETNEKRRLSVGKGTSNHGILFVDATWSVCPRAIPFSAIRGVATVRGNWLMMAVKENKKFKEYFFQCGSKRIAARIRGSIRNRRNDIVYMHNQIVCAGVVVLPRSKQGIPRPAKLINGWPDLTPTLAPKFVQQELSAFFALTSQNPLPAHVCRWLRQ